MNTEIVLDFDNQKNLLAEINEKALLLNLESIIITDSRELLIVKYIGYSDGIFVLGKYIGQRGYPIEIASK